MPKIGWIPRVFECMVPPRRGRESMTGLTLKKGGLVKKSAIIRLWNINTVIDCWTCVEGKRGHWEVKLG